jgi:hypothetical protein
MVQVQKATSKSVFLDSKTNVIEALISTCAGYLKATKQSGFHKHIEALLRDKKLEAAKIVSKHTGKYQLVFTPEQGSEFVKSKHYAMSFWLHYKDGRILVYELC